jgi:hypothetical protein
MLEACFSQNRRPLSVLTMRCILLLRKSRESRNCARRRLPWMRWRWAVAGNMTPSKQAEAFKGCQERKKVVKKAGKFDPTQIAIA